MSLTDFHEAWGVLLLSGPPGAGKSSTARALLERHPRGLHADVDAIRGFVRAGFADPTLDWSGETTAQFTLARRAARAIADIYLREHYFAVVDDMIAPGNPDLAIWESAPVLARVMLLPRASVALARNSERDRGEVTDRLGQLIPAITHEFMRERARAPGWTFLDNSEWSTDETADAVARIVLQFSRSHSRPSP